MVTCHGFQNNIPKNDGMKKLVLIGLCLVAFSCTGPKNSGDRFTVMRIEAGKDGQTLYLKDAEGDEFTTVISIPNGNFTEVHEGDSVQLDIVEVLDTDPVILISRSVEIIGKE